MISHKHKCIFVPIPKTGSSSIRSILKAPALRPHLNICQIRSELRRNWTKNNGFFHHTANWIYQSIPKKKRTQIGERLFDTYYKFGFVRNPWDRVVSLYLRREGLQMRDQMTFDEFTEWIKYSSSTSVHPVPHTNQLDWLVDPHGNILVDYIGKFETLADDWNHIAQSLGIDQQLPHKNKNKKQRKHYTEYYSAKSQEIIQKKFCIDIEHF